MRTFILLFAAFAFTACAESTPEDPKAAPNEAAEVSTPEFNPLGDILASQPEEGQARYTTGTLPKHWLFSASNPA